jgi:hypothetical protein
MPRDHAWGDDREEPFRGNGHDLGGPFHAPDPAGLTVQAWLDRDLPEPDWLLGPFSTTTRGMLVADTGLGKTNFALAMAFAMASGRGFLHWLGSRPARILFIDGEMSARLMRNRIRRQRCTSYPATRSTVRCRR